MVFQDMFYNHNERSKSGDVFHRQKKYRQRKFANRTSFNIQSIDAGADSCDIDVLVHFFNACILPKDEQKLKDKLRSTRGIRSALLSQNNTDYHKIFQFYLVHSEMVTQNTTPLISYIYYFECSSNFQILFDFTIMFPVAKKNELIERIDRK